MKAYWIKTHSIIKKIFSKYIWDIPNTENKIYLTFDDGPTPKITEWVLEQLDKHNPKATFFCIGENIQTNPELFSKIIEKGHAIGNHTFNHLNGWETANEEYLRNVSLCQDIILNQFKKTTLFRPPYGKLKTSQLNALRKQGYKIIMWDVLSADFDTTITPEKCLKNVISNIKSGSIIIFHDSEKAFKNLEYTLPIVLDYIDKSNFGCEIIDSNAIV
jgi:peptidoglycan/xylan/chitin deacetylase (PgdA/CDA1 family)